MDKQAASHTWQVSVELQVTNTCMNGRVAGMTVLEQFK